MTRQCNCGHPEGAHRHVGAMLHLHIGVCLVAGCGCACFTAQPARGVRTVPASTVTTNDRLLVPNGQRRERRKVCEVQHQDGRVSLVLTSRSDWTRLSYRDDDMVEVAA